MHKRYRYLLPLLLTGVTALIYFRFHSKDANEADLFARYSVPGMYKQVSPSYQLPAQPKHPIQYDKVYQHTRLALATTDLQTYNRYAQIPHRLRADLKSLTMCTKMVMQGEPEDTIASPILLRKNGDTSEWMIQLIPGFHPGNKISNSPDGCPIADMYYFGMGKSCALLIYRLRMGPYISFCNSNNYRALLMHLDGHRITHSWEVQTWDPISTKAEALAIFPSIRTI